MRKQVEHLRRLAVVFAVPIRIKIVTETYQREMSPKQFYEEFGGGSPSRVAQHFDKLAKAKWLREVESKGPGGARRGGIERFYRATELAFCDHQTWIALPYSIRLTVSWNGFKEIAAQVRRAMEELTFQALPGRKLTRERLLLDEEGWGRVSAAVAEEFEGQWEEQDDARRRAGHSGEKLFRVGSLLVAFELPTEDGQRFGPSLVANQEPMISLPVRLSKVFEDEVCIQIIDESNRGDISARAVHEKYGKRFGLTRDAIRRRFKRLERIGWIKVVGYKTGGRRRGATEKFYRATGPALYEEDRRGPWANITTSLASSDDWKTFAQLSEQVKEAALAGTLNRRDEMWMAWSDLRLDQEGWGKLVASLEALHAFIRAEHKAAKARLKQSGEQPIVIVAALGAFETPMPVKEP
ncbi:MAG TPA: hypothetical protein VFI09_03595 [Solirubrobacterales bacterium]|nr:hypothetical protein [Solirubrobacterales bacterium]